MKKPFEGDQQGDPIDWFTKEILRDPNSVEELKMRLRQRIWREGHGPVAASNSDDIEDLWDNVPV